MVSVCKYDKDSRYKLTLEPLVVFVSYYPSKIMSARMSRLFKSFEFGNGSRMSDENLVIEHVYMRPKVNSNRFEI